MAAGALLVSFFVWLAVVRDITDLIAAAGWWALAALAFPVAVAVGAWRWSD